MLTFIDKIAKGFDLCVFNISYDKMILPKLCLAKFKKRFSEHCEQLSKTNSSINKNTVKTIFLL
jgi:hypothetical protein